MKEALILIDLQNDYFSGGRMELVAAEAAGANARRLLESFRAKGAPIIHIQHIALQPGATFFLPETDGAAIHDLVKPEEGETLLVKHYPNSFRDTGLHELLQREGIDRLLICGAMSHMCVDTTTRAAFDLGYSCRLAADACATCDLQFGAHLVVAADVHAASMAALGMVFAEVVTTDELLEN